MITFNCRGSITTVPAIALDYAPALRAKVMGAFGDGVAATGVVNVDRDAAAFTAFLRLCTHRGLPDGPMSEDLKEEARFWCASPEAPLAPMLTCCDRDKLRGDVDVFVDFLAHSVLFDTAACAVTAVLPCTRYVHDDRWIEQVDAYKYVVAHPELLRESVFRRWGLEVQWQLIGRVEVELIDYGTFEVAATGEYLLVAKSWEYGTPKQGAFGATGATSFISTCFLAVDQLRDGEIVHGDLRIKLQVARSFHYGVGMRTVVNAEIADCTSLVGVALIFCDLRKEELAEWKVRMQALVPDGDEAAVVAHTGTLYGTCETEDTDLIGIAAYSTALPRLTMGGSSAEISHVEACRITLKR